VDLTIHGNGIVALLGDNGAGKSTLVKALVGLVLPSGGEILFGGAPVEGVLRDIHEQVGYMPQSALALNALTVEAAIRYTVSLRKGRRSQHDAEWTRLAKALDLSGLSERTVQGLSGGERRRAQLAVALAGAPAAVILDEPTNDLDPSWRRSVWNLLEQERAKGTLVIVVTHDVQGVEEVADRVIFMRDGRLVKDCPPSDVVRGDLVRVSIRSGWEGAKLPDGAVNALRAAAGKIIGGRYTMLLDNSELRRLGTWFPDLTEWEISVARPSLEEVFFNREII
jgi:ABC-type multidrug transport system ATPase subunit